MKSLVMLLKSLSWRIRHSAALESDKTDACLVLHTILHDMCSSTPRFWHWKGNDHIILLRNFDSISERLCASNPAFTAVGLENVRRTILAVLGANAAADENIMADA
jgi:hypothetical protein